MCVSKQWLNVRIELNLVVMANGYRKKKRVKQREKRRNRRGRGSLAKKLKKMGY